MSKDSLPESRQRETDFYAAIAGLMLGKHSDTIPTEEERIKLRRIADQLSTLPESSPE